MRHSVSVYMWRILSVWIISVAMLTPLCASYGFNPSDGENQPGSNQPFGDGDGNKWPSPPFFFGFPFLSPNMENLPPPPAPEPPSTSYGMDGKYEPGSVKPCGDGDTFPWPPFFGGFPNPPEKNLPFAPTIEPPITPCPVSNSSVTQSPSPEPPTPQAPEPVPPQPPEPPTPPTPQEPISTPEPPAPEPLAPDVTPEPLAPEPPAPQVTSELPAPEVTPEPPAPEPPAPEVTPEPPAPEPLAPDVTPEPPAPEPKTPVLTPEVAEVTPVSTPPAPEATPESPAPEPATPQVPKTTPEPLTQPPTPPTNLASTTSTSHTKWPVQGAKVSFVAPHVIAAGQVFDGGMKTFERSDLESKMESNASSADAVFIVQPGGILKNAIIGDKNVIGVFCANQGCVLDNVWHSHVSFAAVVVEMGIGTTSLMGGGAKGAMERVILHKAGGSVRVTNFYTEDCNELVESCGTCGPVKRSLYLTNLEVIHPRGPLVRVNKNYNDVAVLSKIKVTTIDPQYQVCAYYEAGKEPKLVGYGRLGALCDYLDSSIQLMLDSR